MLIYACSDLIFATKIGSTAKTLGVDARPARDAAMLAARLDQVDDGKANGPVSCLMVDLDLGDGGIALIEQAKRHTEPVNVIAFGSHVATELLDAAKQAGADQVLPRSAFTANLPGLIKHYGSDV